MRSETEVKELYKQYIYRFALAQIDEDKEKEMLFSGASMALGRTLGKDLKKITAEQIIAVSFINRLREEGKELPGFKEV